MEKEKSTPVLGKKIKAEFEEWVQGKYLKTDCHPVLYQGWFDKFYSRAFDFQSGIYLAFFREKGADVEANPIYTPFGTRYEALPFSHRVISENYNTALIAAIEAAAAKLEGGMQ